MKIQDLYTGLTVYFKYNGVTSKVPLTVVSNDLKRVVLEKCKSVHFTFCEDYCEEYLTKKIKSNGKF